MVPKSCLETAVEGGLIIARTDPANQIMLDDNAVEIGENGVFVIGFHRDSDAPASLRIIAPDGDVKTSLLAPRQRDYNIQRIDGLKSTMVTPPATVLARIKSDGDAVRAARQRQAPFGDFWRGFDWPALGPDFRYLWQPAHFKRPATPAALWH